MDIRQVVLFMYWQKEAIQAMSDDQLKGMVNGFERGASSKDLMKVLEEVDAKQFKTVLSIVKVLEQLSLVDIMLVILIITIIVSPTLL